MSIKLRSAIIEITNACNLGSCIHCSSSAKKVNEVLTHSHPSYGLPDDIVLRCIRELIELGIEVIEVSGGEPTLRPSTVVNICELCNEHNVKVKLFTNGTYIQGLQKIVEELRGRMLRHFKEKFEAHISVHAPLTKKGIEAHSIIIEKTIKEAKKDIRLKIDVSRKLLSKGVYVCWHFTVIRVNYNMFEKVIKLANELGIKIVSFLRLVPQGKARGNWDVIGMNENDWRKFFRECYNFLLEYDGNTRLRFRCPINWFFKYAKIEEVEKLRNLGIYPPPKCMANEEHIAIEPDGTVIPCSAFKGLKNMFTSGNINNTSLKDIVSRQEHSYFMAIKRILSSQCLECTFKTMCLRKCIAQRLYTKYDVDDLCRFLKHD